MDKPVSPFPSPDSSPRRTDSLPEASSSPLPPDQRIRTVWLGAVRWLEQNSLAPSWLPEPLRHPLIGYLVAALLELATTILILLLSHFFPSFAFHGMLTDLVVVLMALGWGAGPGLCAVGTFLLYYALLAPHFILPLADSVDNLGLILYLVVGVTISLMASRSEQRRREAQELARGLAQAQAKSALDYQRLHVVLDAIPSSVVIAGPQGQLEEANEATRNMWGGEIAMVSEVAEYDQYKAWWVKTGEPVAPEEWALARALSSGETQLNDEVEIEARDGRRKIIFNSAVPIRDEDGTVIGAVANAQDITEVRRLERAVDERAGELETLFEAVSDGIALMDTRGALVQTNLAFRTMFGFTSHPEIAARCMEDQRERSATLAMRDEQGQPLDERTWPSSRLLQGETLVGFDILVTTLDGRELVVEVTGSPVRDETGQITSCVEVMRDVTARRQLEQRTRDALNALVAIGDTLVQVEEVVTKPAPGEAAPSLSAEAILPIVASRVAELTRDVLGCRCVSIVAINPETGFSNPVTVVGLSPKQERTWRTSWSQSQRLDECLSPAMVEALHAGEPVLVDTASLPNRSWNIFPGARNGLIIPMRIGEELVGALMVDYGMHDHDYTVADEVTLIATIARLGALVLERDRLLHEWTEARANELALRDMNAEMDTFVGIVSHELKGPLTVMLLNLDLTERRLRQVAERLIATGEAGERAVALFREHLARTQQQVKKQQRLVDDLVDASRVQSGELALRMEACDLGDIVQGAVDTQRQLAPDRTIILHRPEDGCTLVYADSVRIEQVVTNYLTNALKYSPADRPVEVGVRMDGRQARVWVRDEGPGLPDEEHERIWERFHRVKGIEVLSGVGVGLGLGLHICRTIVERHQGQVGVESAPDAGSIFWFTLPLAQVATPASVSGEPSEASAPSRGVFGGDAPM